MAKKEKLCTFLEEIEKDRYPDEDMEEAAFSRQHYQAIADILAEYAGEDKFIPGIVADLVEFFKQDNPRFDEKRFMDAAGVKTEEVEDDEDVEDVEEAKEDDDEEPVEEPEEEPEDVEEPEEEPESDEEGEEEEETPEE